MNKTFSLHHPRKADARVLDAIKHEVRKYVKRERRKKLPEGFSSWDFECRVGPVKSESAKCLLKEVSAALDAVAAGGADVAYIEISTIPVAREPREVGRSRHPASRLRIRGS